MQKEYIVSLEKGVDYDQFWSEMESNTNGLTFVPDRQVEIVNNRDGSTRNCHYALTKEEAELLKNDDRVLDVDIPITQKEGVKLGYRSTTQLGNFTKPSSQSDSNNTYLNWGLIRNSSTTNNYGTGTTTPLNYIYDFDGTGVDVVISDSGLQVNHPEFQDSSGNSRVQQINWYTASGLPGTQSPNHYRDYHGHGTHVAGTAAGKTYGWAKNSKIYSVKVGGLEGSGDSGTGISYTDCMDVIKLWHRNKGIDPILGHKRPTIVNMSWGWSFPYGYYGITGGSYRGTPWSGSSADLAKGMYSYYNHPIKDTATDVDLQELLDEGVIVCIAAGNSNHKIDVLGGIDYNNYYTDAYGTRYYYHRGSSPYSTDAIIVGSLNNSPQNTTLDKKASYSNAGPGIDIFAAGTYIMSSTSNINFTPIGSYVDAPYYANSSFKQLNLSGTSMASPQVCGIGALMLQTNYTANSSVLKSLIKSNGTTTVYSTGLNNDYTDTASQFGGNTKVIYINPLLPVTPPDSTTNNVAFSWSGTGGWASVTFTRSPFWENCSAGTYDYGFEGAAALDSWTVVTTEQGKLLDGAHTIAGWPTPTVSTTGTAGWDTLNSSLISASLSTDVPTGGGSQSLKFTINGTVNTGTMMYGPYVYSNFSVCMKSGDTVSFDWKADSLTDAYRAYAYLVDIKTGNKITLLNDNSPNSTYDSNWATVTTTLTSGQNGTYKIVFVCGAWDSTYGTAIDNDMFIDKIRFVVN
jgi:hypothetical protein